MSQRFLVQFWSAPVQNGRSLENIMLLLSPDLLYTLKNGRSRHAASSVQSSKHVGNERVISTTKDGKEPVRQMCST